MKKLTIVAVLLAIISVVTTSVFADAAEKRKVRKTSEETAIESNSNRNNDKSSESDADKSKYE